MDHDLSSMSERAGLGAGVATHDPVMWRANWTLERFDARDILTAGLDPAIAQADQILAAGVEAYDVLERAGNLLMFGGASTLWQALIGNGTGTGGQTLTFFNNANAHIGVGNSNTAAAATQTDLQGASKTRKAMDATYPLHTDGVVSGAATIQFKSTFATGDANYAWEEWGVFNGASGGRMLNRKVEALGTKTSAASWALTVSLTLA